MPKVNVYLPDDLAAAVRRAGVPVSSICQQALAEAVRVAGETRGAAEAIRSDDFDPRRHPEIAARATPRTRQVLELARGLTPLRELVASEHLLAGLIDEGAGLAMQILQRLDVDTAALRDAAVPRRRKPRPAAVGEPFARLSPEAREVVAAALDAASELGHDYLGTEHLLVGLASQTETKGGWLLGERGVTADGVRHAIPGAIAAVTPGAGVAEVMRRLDDIDRRLRAGGL